MPLGVHTLPYSLRASRDNNLPTNMLQSQMTQRNKGRKCLDIIDIRNTIVELRSFPKARSLSAHING
ncbi:hypothetical protein PoB_006572200 [Plakobranchus ocellatus]|uniref:Uncharacterized protein n=1 Tax=Plakobranchus ocellatus TaxID=259542 RepID=A0AAV4D4Y5_9GAST|nr:hypothetical protein PoB_006572200 [Plakobranchus ocellatus]